MRGTGAGLRTVRGSGCCTRSRRMQLATSTGTSRSTPRPYARTSTRPAPFPWRRKLPRGACSSGRKPSGLGGTGPLPGGGGARGEALGPSRGGFTTKIHLSADGRCRVLSLVLTPGQRADCTQFEAVMEAIRVPRLTVGRPRTTPDSVSADKAYSNRRTRCYLRRRGIRHVIPEKSDQAKHRIKRGKGGGRPPGFDKERYKKRNVVERAIGKFKHRHRRCPRGLAAELTRRTPCRVTR
ncbi:MAG: hypothetical protein QOF44_1989 [Streptomyces sp.]|nr:hypothetical protein [Streptomyces sp.]